jgi:hypothetical protein
MTSYTIQEMTEFMKAATELAAASPSKAMQETIVGYITSALHMWTMPYIRVADTRDPGADLRAEIDVLEVRLCEWIGRMAQDAGRIEEARLALRFLVEDLRGGTLWRLLKGETP